MKTSAELEAEIKYYEQELERRTSPDRQLRAVRAIRWRKDLLGPALKREAAARERNGDAAKG